MMLPSDMALIWDPAMKKYVEVYAKDKDRFYKVELIAHPTLSFSNSFFLIIGLCCCVWQVVGIRCEPPKDVA